MFIKLYKSRKACIPFLCLNPPSCLRPHLSYENKFLINEHVKEDCNIWSDISSWIHRILCLTYNYIWAYSFLRAQSLKSVVSTSKLSWPDNTYSRGKTISSVFCLVEFYCTLTQYGYTIQIKGTQHTIWQSMQKSLVLRPQWLVKYNWVKYT